jgi:molecular chaperone GrpE (heat shock protein)
MKSGNAQKAKTLALAIAIGMATPATAVRADELQDLKAQIEALQNQIKALQKKSAKWTRRHRHNQQDRRAPIKLKVSRL